MYLEKRRQRWYACHDIPTDARPILNGAKRFVKSLGTDDRGIAKERAAGLEAEWRKAVREARNALQAARNASDPAEKAALVWQEHWRGAADAADRKAVIDHVAEEALQLDPAGGALAQRFYDIATGKRVRFDQHLDEHAATLRNEAKSVAMKRATIKVFAAAHPFVADATRKRVQEWVNGLATSGKAVATIRRSLSELRGYWRYLQAVEVASADAFPFDRLAVPRPSSRGNGDGERQPFTAKDVVRLLQAARKKDDGELADLIALGMWTGARIEELSALKTDAVDLQRGYFAVADAKTQAGVRQVPIHPQLKSTLARLVKGSRDGFVLSGLAPNKYGDRSNAIGKRFGRLKKAEGFGEAHVFHSIRHTVATMLENAGVNEFTAAAILGHDRPGMTFGLYSGGPSLSVKRRAIRKLRYPAA